MLGYQKGELVGANLRRLVDEKGFEEIQRQTETRKNGKVSRYELVLYDKYGKPHIAQVSASPLWDEKGNFAGALAIVMDVTERRRAEDALREKEEKFRKIFENANDYFIYLNTHGTILDVNKKATQVFGGLREELIRKHFLKLGVVSAKDVPRLLKKYSRIIMGKRQC